MVLSVYWYFYGKLSLIMLDIEILMGLIARTKNSSYEFELLVNYLSRELTVLPFSGKDWSYNGDLFKISYKDFNNPSNTPVLDLSNTDYDFGDFFEDVKIATLVFSNLDESLTYTIIAGKNCLLTTHDGLLRDLQAILRLN